MTSWKLHSRIPVLLLATLMGGCGSVTVRHVPEPPPLSTSQVPDLRGTPPLDVGAGEASSAEVEFGSVGVGKVVGSLKDWSGAAAAHVKAELVRAGATVSPGASRVLTVTVSSAKVESIPIVGGATGTVSISVKTSAGTSSEYQGTSSSLAPLRAINGAASEAVRLMFADPRVIAFLRQ